MGKWYEKKHRKEWELELCFKGWLTGNKTGTSSFCTLCNIELRAHQTDLLKHAATVKHKQQLSKTNPKQQLHNFGIGVISQSVKEKELIISAYIANHSAISSVDHLGELYNKLQIKSGPQSSKDCQNDILHLHRTRCGAIIREVIAPCLLAEVIKDIGNEKFSLIVDESTDCTTEKLLAVCIKYYSKVQNDISTYFIGFISVIHTTAVDLFNALIDYLSSKKIQLNQLIGIGTDGASNLCGKNHSLYTLLKEKFNLPHLILNKCICHSLHLCASKASIVFGNEIDFLLKETYNWFKNSTIRVNNYNDIYLLLNIDGKFSKPLQLSSTRWLSRYRAVERICNQFQYMELKTSFTSRS